MYLRVHQGIPLRALVSREIFYSKNHYCYYLDPTRYISSGRLDTRLKKATIKRHNKTRLAGALVAFFRLEAWTL